MGSVGIYVFQTDLNGSFFSQMGVWAKGETGRMKGSAMYLEFVSYQVISYRLAYYQTYVF